MAFDYQEIKGFLTYLQMLCSTKPFRIQENLASGTLVYYQNKLSDF